MTVDEVHSRNLLKGPSAFLLLRWRYAATTLFLIITLVMLAFMHLLHIPQSWFTNTLVAIWFASTIPVQILVARSNRKILAERKAGYTTRQGKNGDLEQRDPYVGRVIREVGGEYLTGTTFRALIQAAKRTQRSHAAAPAHDRQTTAG